MKIFNQEPKKVETTDTKMKIYGFVMLLLVTIFCVIVITMSSKHNQKELAKLEEVNEKNSALSAEATEKRDALFLKTLELKVELSNVQGQLIQQNKILDKFEASYSGSLKELKQLRNETNYIPTNVSIGMQSSYLSNYKYKPY